ncbi:MAG: hypothetical protein IJK56_03725 [Firmicutes bacterium]|nr:hypothetical protein [Bacillota bacterium]
MVQKNYTFIYQINARLFLKFTKNTNYYLSVSYEINVQKQAAGILSKSSAEVPAERPGSHLTAACVGCGGKISKKAFFYRQFWASATDKS